MATDGHDGWLSLLCVLCVQYIRSVIADAWEWVHWFGDVSPSSPGLKILTGQTFFMPVMEKKLSDKHWDSKIARKPFRTPNDVLAHLKECEYRVSAAPHQPHRACHLSPVWNMLLIGHLLHRLESKTKVPSCPLGHGCRFSCLAACSCQSQLLQRERSLICRHTMWR